MDEEVKGEDDMEWVAGRLEDWKAGRRKEKERYFQLYEGKEEEENGGGIAGGISWNFAES